MVFTSTLARTEVIGDRHDSVLRNAFKSLFDRPSFVMMDNSSAIADIAGDLRVAVREATGRRLRSPDATYIATALTVGVDALHSFDDDMLGLDGLSCVQGLPIKKPKGNQMTLGI